jgi:acrylyl-CoA reductase (NADPH)
VGGATTAYLLRTTKYGGSVALSGLTGGTALATTVLPFILRGVQLLGIDSVNCTIEERQRVWTRCASDLKPDRLVERIAIPIGLDEVGRAAGEILRGAVRGRYLVRVAT